MFKQFFHIITSKYSEYNIKSPWRQAPPLGPVAQAGAVSQRAMVGANSQALRVLVVDDYKTTRKGLKELLQEDSKIKVTIAASGEKAWEYFMQATEQPFDVVITDLNMPGGMNGITLAKQIKDKFPAVYIVLMSTDINPRRARLFAETGVIDYAINKLDTNRLLLCLNCVFMLISSYELKEAFLVKLQDKDIDGRYLYLGAARRILKELKSNPKFKKEIANIFVYRMDDGNYHAISKAEALANSAFGAVHILDPSLDSVPQDRKVSGPSAAGGTEPEALKQVKEALQKTPKFHGEAEPAEEQFTLDESGKLNALIMEFKRIIEEKAGAISALELLEITLNNIRQGKTALRGEAGNSVMAQIDELANDIRTVGSSMDQEINFKCDNIAYRALIEIVLAWPKRDVHCHLSNSLHVNFISSLFMRNLEYASQMRDKAVGEVRKSAAYYAKEGNDPSKADYLHALASQWEKDIEAFNAVFRDPEALYEHVTYGSSERFSYKKDVRDLPILFVEDLKDAACHVAKQCFADGVVYFDLRFNPYKASLRCEGKTLNDLPLYEHLRVAVEAVSQGLSEAEEWADKKLGGEHKAGMIFSFARNKPEFKNNPGLLTDIVKELGKIKNDSQQLGQRMVGIDLSGAAEGSTGNYLAALRAAKEYNLLRTVHFDELRMHMRSDREKVNAAIGNVEGVISELERIGHGLPLALLDNSLKADAELNSRLETLWGSIREKGQLIECCPSTNLKSLQIR
ncbi:MAG: response regulator, partial [Candidatus Omnitrophota bacterium]